MTRGDGIGRRRRPHHQRPDDPARSLGGKRRLFPVHSGFEYRALLCAADLAAKKWSDPATASSCRNTPTSWNRIWKRGASRPGHAGARNFAALHPHAADLHQADGCLPAQSIGAENLDTATIYLKNPYPRTFPRPRYRRRWILGAGALRHSQPHDPIIVNTVKIIDAKLKDDLPGGPCYHRYNNDGYGEDDNGNPFNGAGVGRPWPLLTGERGHYEVAAGRDAKPYIGYMTAFAGSAGCSPSNYGICPICRRRSPRSSSATRPAPPCRWPGPTPNTSSWSGPSPTARSSTGSISSQNRYLVQHAPSPLEIWNLDRQLKSMSAARPLRIPLGGSLPPSLEHGQLEQFHRHPIHVNGGRRFLRRPAHQPKSTGKNDPVHFLLDGFPDLARDQLRHPIDVRHETKPEYLDDPES